jgi:hypothetical protein
MTKRAVSSANSRISETRPEFISLIKIRNKIGPSTESWGTPALVCLHLDEYPSKTTLCMLYMKINREHKIVRTVQSIHLECTDYIAFNNNASQTNGYQLYGHYINVHLPICNCIKILFKYILFMHCYPHMPAEVHKL